MDFSILDFDINAPVAPEKYMRIELEDFPDVNLAPAVEKAHEFVSHWLEKGERVLVHCNMGKSRSASIMVLLVHKVSLSCFVRFLSFA